MMHKILLFDAYLCRSCQRPWTSGRSKKRWSAPSTCPPMTLHMTCDWCGRSADADSPPVPPLLCSDSIAFRMLRLVQNAITYNSPHSMFGVVASILAQIGDRRFALITRSATADPGRPMPDRPGWPTFQQKKKFYDICTRLTLADLNQMVSLVQRGCQTAVQQCGDKEVEVRG